MTSHDKRKLFFGFLSVFKRIFEKDFESVFGVESGE